MSNSDYIKASNSYWNYVSSLTPASADESIKDLFKNSFELMSNYLDDIHYISANIIFMNYVCDVSQKNISKIYGLSQYGVSKQIKSAKRKLKFSIMKPESNSIQVRDDLYYLININNVETITLYYFIKMYSIVSKILNNITEGAIRNRVVCSINELKIISKAKNKDDLIKIMRNIDTRYELNFDERPFEWYTNNADRYYSYLSEILKINNYSDFQYKLRGTI